MSPSTFFANSLTKARAICARRWPELTAEELDEAARELVADWMREAAEERESIEDTATVANCDDYGTGEGRYHGRIG